MVVTKKLDTYVNISIIITLAVLLFRPSGVVGRWIVDRYDAWRQRSMIEQLWPQIANNARSQLRPRSGAQPLDSSAVMVEFIDYQCPVCRQMAPTVSSALDEYGVSVAIRHFPLDIHPAARDAALAAICAERHGAFQQAHEALLSDETWIETQDWTNVATAMGVEPGTLETCMAGPASVRRLTEDIDLAQSIGVRGTPTFVTGSGVFLGLPGLQDALSTIEDEAAERRRSQGAPMNYVPADEAVFSSGDHPDPALAELVGARYGFFRSDRELLIVDRVELLLVDISGADVRMEGGEGGGPGEYTRTASFVRTTEGFIAWDAGQGRITFLSRDGEVTEARRYDLAGLNSYFLTEAIAGLPDGTVIVRDGLPVSEWPAGRSSNPARYLALQGSGQTRVIAEAEGDEVYMATSGLRLSGEVIFGHRTLEAALDGGFVIAETKQQVIEVLDWDGHLLSRFAIPWEARGVSGDQVRRARDERAALNERFLARAGGIMAQRGRDMPAPGREAYSSISMNESAPAIDKLLVDFDNRLWVRRYQLPGDPDIRWRALGTEDGGLIRELKLELHETLLDAHGDTVLLRSEDELGIVQVQVKRTVPIARQL